MAYTCQNPTGIGTKGENMARSCNIRRLCIIRSGNTNGMRPVCGGNACAHTFPRFDRDRKRRAILGGVIALAHHHGQFQLRNPLGSQRQADKATGMGDHKVHGLRGHELRSHNKVPLIFAVFIIHHHNHAARTHGGYGTEQAHGRMERHALLPLCHFT